MTNEEIDKEIEELKIKYKLILEDETLSQYDKVRSTPTSPFVQWEFKKKRNITNLGKIREGEWTEEFIVEEIGRLSDELSKVEYYKHLSTTSKNKIKDFFESQIKRLDDERNKREEIAEFRARLSYQGQETFDTLMFLKKYPN
jgi:hypothetical protein